MSQKPDERPRDEPDARTDDSVPEETDEESVATREELEEECSRLKDRLLRLTAEYENYRKRMAREQGEWGARAVERLVLDLLPVLDSFDRALAAAGEAKEADAVLNGMILVHRQLLGALKSHGVEPFDATGEPFDPNLHEAFMSRPAESGEEPGTIVEEFVKGYRMGDRTFRPTKGIVAARPEEHAGSGGDPGEE